MFARCACVWSGIGPAPGGAAYERKGEMANSQSPARADAPPASTVPLSRIVIEAGFNPRTEIDPTEQRKLEHSIEQRGILQAVLVAPRDDGDFTLIAGERRLLAAAKVGLVDIPITLRSSREDGDNLVDAVLENQLHASLNPIEEALACRRLLETRLSRKEIAVKLEMTQATVKDRLAILDLPEDLWPKIANGQIPLLAVKALVGLKKIHEDLARAAAAGVLDPNDAEPSTWAEVAKSPLAVAVHNTDALPAGVFRAGASYPLERFSLNEKTTADLAAYTKLTGAELKSMYFDQQDLEQARLLGAAHDYGWGSLIVGKDVAERLIEDGIAKALKDERARQRRERQHEKAQATDTPENAGGDPEPARQESAAEQEWRSEQEAKAKRQAEQEQRERAIQYNLDLGVLALKHLLKLKVDERVLRILASVYVTGDLRGLASRGARLALPGWPTQTRQRNGKVKTSYLDPDEAQHRAEVFLKDADGPTDIAGRSLALLALASLADEDAIARTRRSAYTLSFKGPWARQAERDLHAIIREQIKPGQLPALDEILDRRIAETDQAAARDAEMNAARLRLEQLPADGGELDADALENALKDAELVWGRYGQQTRELRTQLNKASRPAEAGTSDQRAEHSDGEKVLPS
jgi:ParB/RepB/Spo0J family partition protein